MSIKKLIFSILAFSIMMSCESIDSSDINLETPIYQDYGMTYNQTNNTTHVNATFRVKDENGVRLRLSKGASVLFNGESEDFFNTLSDHFYHWKRKGAIDVEVKYKKNAKTSFTNTLSISRAPDIGFRNDFNSLSFENKNMISWNGEAIQQGEVVSINIIQKKRSYFSKLEKEGSFNIEIPSLKSLGFTTGSAEINLSKTHTIYDIDNADKPSGGRISYTNLIVKAIEVK
ncbi:Probable lipoprotein precursor [Tenacibaculum maritimum]|uniref:hypothetical protein n=1 Tax=Tenacibaculum maritimum TaxID=107401 RepID=UPI0012E4EB9E|nr:hypothetical protein [Tenacibaculum maritimum]CAA0150878.1 Probable lipoprotein precursor [Tenacibaculum maritimum]CAA0194503.1 Probable lipoprotein precursor [Tenacibaculum maritimum]CAA0218185.1 Probable lipoprotein precursor [Tenacibaculum maritimum]